MIRLLQDNVFPETEHSVATSYHVGILRFVHVDSLYLFGFWTRELLRVSMPVVPIKLNNQVVSWYESINQEFLANQILWEVINPKLIENTVSYPFDLGHFHGLLLNVHVQQHFSTGRVCVTALDRTVQDVEFPTSRSGWRPLKTVLTYFTGMCGLIPTLPFIVMFCGTEVVFFALLMSTNIDHFPAHGTRELFPCSPFRFGGCSEAVMGAILLFRVHPPSDFFVASFTDDGSDCEVGVLRVTHGYSLYCQPCASHRRDS